MAITLKGSVPRTSNSTSIDVARSTGANTLDQNNLEIVGIVTTSGSLTAIPTGWTYVTDIVLDGGQHLSIYSHYHEGLSEPSAWSFTNSTSGRYSTLNLGFSGNKPLTIDVVGIQKNASSLDVTAPSIDPNYKDGMLVYFGAAGNTASWTAPDGYAAILQQAALASVTLGATYKTAATGDPTGPVTATINSAAVNAGALLFIREDTSVPDSSGTVTATIGNTPDISFAPTSSFAFTLTPTIPVLTRSISNTPDISFGIDAATWSLGPNSQTLRPMSDDAVGGWTNQDGDTTSLYLSINEVTASALEYIQSSADPVNDTARFKVDPSVADPNVSEGYVFDYWIGKSGSGTVNLTVRIVQGLSTEIAAWTHTDVAAGPTPVTQTLTALQADAITDHTDLYLEFTASI